jgi:hypothetical protein
MNKRSKFKYKRFVIADAGFVINLPKRTDRKEQVTKTLKDLKFSGWEFFEGITESDPFWHKYGCTQSFIKIFEKSIKENYKSIVIFEDDIRLASSCNVQDIDNIFRNWRKESKKYDLIGLGTRPLDDAKVLRESENFGKITNCVCAHAWYYTLDFMKYAVEELKDIKNPEDKNYRTIIDEFINDSCSTEYRWKTHNKIFRAGVTIPLMFVQSPGFSDNENGYFDYTGFIEDLYYMALRRGDEIIKNKLN